VQNDEHLLTLLRYIEANPLRAKVVERAEQYRWSSYPVHGQGATSELVDRLVSYEQLSPYATVRQRRWAQKVHRPQVDETMAAIRRSNESGLPFGEAGWVRRLAHRLDLDLTIRPRGRPRKLTATN
jgi:putative transposase